MTSGYLLVSGALDPVLTNAITMMQGGDVPAVTELDAVPVTDWQYFDDRPEWSSVRGVPQVSGPSDPVAPDRPDVAPPENPHHWRFSSAAAMPHYTLKARTSCFQPRGPGTYVAALTTTPGKGRVTIKWWDLGDPDTQSYQIAVIPNDQVGTGPRTLTRWVSVAAPKACKQVSTTISGLKSGAAYKFILVATNISRTQKGVTYRPTRGETETVKIL
jgi:hypothetical protein